MAHSGTWVVAGKVDEIDLEDVIRFDYGEHSFAIYRTDQDEFYATDGLCTHEKFHLADGLVMGHTIECPKHNGRFVVRTGAAMRVPVCVNVVTYPVRVEEGNILIRIEP